MSCLMRNVSSDSERGADAARGTPSVSQRAKSFERQRIIAAWMGRTKRVERRTARQHFVPCTTLYTITRLCSAGHTTKRLHTQ